MNLLAMAGLWHTVTFRGGYNTNVVLAGTVVLGLASGVLGCFLLLRRRSLVADALSHAALPGVCVAFLVATALGGEARSLGALLPGAALFGLLGVACVQLLTTLPRVREDAAIGVVLSVFFAGGVVLLSVIQGLDTGSRAGLQRFIFGQAATMSAADSRLIAIIAALVLLSCAAAYKELRLLCFDAGFARGLGWSTLALDGLLLAGLTAITVAGLHAVGAILMVALVIIPPATARFWTERFGWMLVIAGFTAALGCFAGTAASAVLADVPTGPAIVLACGGLFVASMLVAPQRGLITASWRRLRVSRSIAREHLLRAMYELGETSGDARGPVSVEDLLTRRRWSEARVRRLLRHARRRGEVETADGGRHALTERGAGIAARIVRGHRLWEHFLTTFAGVAPSHVDRGADEIEHVLGHDLVAQLEASLRALEPLPEEFPARYTVWIRNHEISSLASMTPFLQLDFPAFAAGALAAMSCAIVGSYLVLRRMSLMGDAISHAVLPGIIAAYVFSGSLHALPVFIGCAIVGMLTALISDLVHRLARIEPGASMGVVFTVFFAAGVVWLSQVEASGGRGVHLDADCVLYGVMEGVIWPNPPETLAAVFTAEPWQDFPRQVSTLLIVLVIDAMFVTLLFKELRISAFDPALSAAQGIPPGLMHYLLMTVVAMTTVAAFEAVGSILVVAMLIVPALVAHLLTDRLVLLVPLSAGAALVASALGVRAAASAWSVNAAGMIGVTLGVALGVTGLLSPHHGWLARLGRRILLSVSIRADDMLGALYRGEEQGIAGPWTRGDLVTITGGGWLGRLALVALRRRGQIAVAAGAVSLTRPGRAAAADLVRSHRLWESWLVHRMGLRPDHVHGTAMRLEHLTGQDVQEELARGLGRVETDPHGRVIPGAETREDDA